MRTGVDAGAHPDPEPVGRRPGDRSARGPVTGRWRRVGPLALPPLAVPVFAGVAAAGTFLSAQVAGGGPLLSTRWSFLARLALWAVVWLAGVAAVFRLPRRAALPLIGLTAVALRLAALAGPPTLTDDFHRYAWDGRVQAAGINPYEHPPNSPELAGLREGWLWPEDRPCPVAKRPGACTRINRVTVPTIYPPAAEAWFAVIYRLTGIEARWKPWQVAGLLTDVAVVGLLAVGLQRRGKDPRWAALYALCPAPVVEVVNNGHVDGLAVVAAVAALVVARPSRSEPAGSGARREVVAGALVGLATLVKLYPALLVPALAAGSPGRRLPALARLGGGAAAVVVAGYLPHVLQVGTKVVGFLPGYLREEKYDSGGRYLVAGAAGIPAELAGALAVLALAAAVVWVWTRRPAAPVGAAVLVGTLLLAASPAQPWYAVTLLAVATLAVEPIWAVVVAPAYPYFFAVILSDPHRVGIGQVAYGLAAGAVAGAALLRGYRRRRRSMRGCPPSEC